MSSLSRLALVQPDPQAAAALRYGFESAGITVVDGGGEALDRALEAGPDVVVTGGRDADEGRENLARIRAVLDGSGSALPVFYVGNGLHRDAALSAGASEVVPAPVFARDVVTLARLATSGSGLASNSIGGELADHFGLFYLVRAISATRRRAVLTLVRGLRRGELRFFDGEVTSAQVGVLHGLAALHQLLLWNQARFELRSEDVVRRRQIPLGPEEVIEDARRFLGEIQSAAGELTPSAVYLAPAEAGSDLPAEVGEVLRLFDGSRSVADVIEDSPYRVFETLRITRRLCELELIVLADQGEVTPSSHALAIEEWLVGDERATSADAGVDSVGPAPGQPASPPAERLSGEARRQRRSSGPPVGADRAPTDWSQLLPGGSSSDQGSLSPVVPSTSAAGEISSDDRPSARAARAGIEAGVPAPSRERLEERIESRELAKVFVDDELGSETSAQRRQRAERVDPLEPPSRSQWDEETQPAKLVAITAAYEDTAPREPASVEVEGEGGAADAAAQDAIEEPKVSKKAGKKSAKTSKKSRKRSKPVTGDRAASDSASETARDAAALSELAASAGPARADSADADDRDLDTEAITIASDGGAATEDVASFSADEEAFFKAGSKLASGEAEPAVESFDDLDEDYEIPRTFWQRLLSDPNQVPKGKKK